MGKPVDTLKYKESWNTHISTLSGIAWYLTDREDFKRLKALQGELMCLVAKASEEFRVQKKELATATMAVAVANIQNKGG